MSGSLFLSFLLLICLNNNFAYFNLSINSSKDNQKLLNPIAVSSFFTIFARIINLIKSILCIYVVIKGYFFVSL